MANEQIIKPMSVARYEFINNLKELINSCMLPPFVIEEVLKDTCSKISVVSAQQLNDDLKSYKTAIEKAAGKNNSI